MLQRIRKAMKEESGFTLIELLIVIVILGILAAIVVFSVSGITDRGATSACKSDVATVTTAEESYYAQTGGYATTTAILQGAGFLHSAPTDMTIAVLTGPPASVTVTGLAPCAGFTS